MCGIAGAIGVDDAAQIVFKLMLSQQHRGQEGAGLAVWNEQKQQLNWQLRLGLVSHLQEKIELAEFRGRAAIGHNRYGTVGGSRIENVQPLVSEIYCSASDIRHLAVAHNGDLVAVDYEGETTGIEELRRRLYPHGVSFKSTTDTELVFPLIAREGGDNVIENIHRVANRLHGAFSMLFFWQGHLVVVKDPWDMRPLSLGQYKGGYVFASENATFRKLGIEFMRDVERGEIITISPDLKMSSRFIERTAQVRPARCSFCFVYFARPDSVLWGISVSKMRRLFGEAAAQESFNNGTLPLNGIVVPILDSGRTVSLPVAEKILRENLLAKFLRGELSKADLEHLLIPLAFGMNRNQYLTRNFITPSQDQRQRDVSLKHNVDEAEVSGQEVVEVDDSKVRGTTTANHVRLFRNAGATKVHVLIPSPPVKHPCYFGIDMKSPAELISATKTLEEERRQIGADSLTHLSLPGFKRCLGCPENFCTACFSGEYPMPIPPVS